MFNIQKTKKQTEELNSSKIKEALVSYMQVYRSIENGLEEGVFTPFESHVLFDRLICEISEILTSVGSNVSDCEPVEELCVDDFFVQSSDAIIPIDESQTTDQINVGFADQEDTKTTLAPVTSTLYKPSGSKNASIVDFLSRPVNILTTNWAVGNSIDTAFKPWNLFFNHASIKKKIDNYAFIRCDLHLKIMVNAHHFIMERLCILMCQWKEFSTQHHCPRVVINWLVILKDHMLLCIHSQVKVAKWYYLLFTPMNG
jgi:hypothetical protein